MKASNEQLIVRYLLGDLPEEEQVTLEDRAFSDREYRREIEDAENDLIDEYVRGALTETRRRQFESRFLVSAERRRKIEFARALAQVVAAQATDRAAQPVTPRWWEALIAFLRGFNPALQFSLAAALILFVGVAWLFTETRRLRTQIAQLQAEQQTQQRQEETLRQEAASERTRSAELTAQLERERAQWERSAEPARRLEHRQRERSVASAFIASLFLPPGIARSGAERPQLIVPDSSRLARLQIGLEREDDFKSFRVELRTAQGQAVWTQDRLRPRESRAGRVISLTIPGRVLSTGEYELTLRGVVDHQTIEDVRYYYFSVLKK